MKKKAIKNDVIYNSNYFSTIFRSFPLINYAAFFYWFSQRSLVKSSKKKSIEFMQMNIFTIHRLCHKMWHIIEKCHMEDKEFTSLTFCILKITTFFNKKNKKQIFGIFLRTPSAINIVVFLSFYLIICHKKIISHVTFMLLAVWRILL